MASVTLTLTDTPTGAVSVHTEFKPAIGAPCSPAQAAAMDIISRTRKDYGLDVPGLKDRRVTREDLSSRTGKATRSAS